MATTPLIIDASIAAFEKNATAAAGLLKSMANEKRLMILCKLLEQGEVSVLGLAGEVGLSQSALSQHLARMREDGIVGFRRDGQTLFYRLADPKAANILATLKDMYC
jgi:ArsR family transcriptional regulator